VSRALHLVVSGVARYAGQLAVFALVAVVLGPDQAGHYALALAVTAPVFVVAGLGLRPVFLTISPRVAAHDEVQGAAHARRLRPAATGRRRGSVPAWLAVRRRFGRRCARRGSGCASGA
jgi:hypothetical protein